MINQFLMDLSVTQRIFLYDFFGNVMLLVFFLSLLLIMRKYQLRKAVSLKIILSYAIAYLSAVNICPLLYNLTGGIVPEINLGVAFLPFLLVVLLLSRLLGVPSRLCADISVPVFILGRGVGILGCLFFGCCHGATVPWGLYSYQEETTVIPIAIIDAVVSWIIAGYLLKATKRGCYSATGKVATTGLLLFGPLRFVVDILRHNHKLFWRITADGICGILYMLAGWFLLYRIAKGKNQS